MCTTSRCWAVIVDTNATLQEPSQPAGLSQRAMQISAAFSSPTCVDQHATQQKNEGKPNSCQALTSLQKFALTSPRLQGHGLAQTAHGTYPCLQGHGLAQTAHGTYPRL